VEWPCANRLALLPMNYRRPSAKLQGLNTAPSIYFCRKQVD
jgi:hypothetical protein